VIPTGYWLSRYGRIDGPMEPLLVNWFLLKIQPLIMALLMDLSN